MNAESQANLYKADYLRWVETTIEKLKDRDFANVDWENLIDEIGDLARNERRTLSENLTVLLVCLLKWKYQPQLRSGSWKGRMVELRHYIRDDIEDSPSLEPYLEEVFNEGYEDAIEQAVAATGLPPETFPQACPYSISEVLDTSFFPE